MIKGLFRKLSVLVILLSLLSAFACSTVNEVYLAGAETVNLATDLIMPDEKPVLKKKVMVAPVINQTGINKFDEKVRQILISNLAQDEFLLVSSLNKGNSSISNSKTLQYGIIIDSEQVKNAREMGANILVSCVFHSIESDIKRKGIWPLRENRRVIGISVSINAIDTINNTLVVSRNETLYVKTDEKDPDSFEKWKPDINLLEKEIPSVLEKLSSSITEKLRQYPWQSRIHMAENNKYVIKAGRNIGIDTSTVFELFTKGESIKSLTGEEYFILGEKIGEVGIKSVSQDVSTLAMTLNGNSNAELIRVKRDK